MNFTELKTFFRKSESTRKQNIHTRIMDNLTDNFFGYLSGKSFLEKKEITIEIYRYFYRFSFEKVMKLINNEYFVSIILQYI